VKDAPRIDAHQHFWHYSPTTHGWIDDSMVALRRDFLPNDLAPLLAEGGLAGSIAVQAQQDISETRWLLELADAHPFIRGVVGWVDLLADDVRGSIEDIAAHPKLVGVRELVQSEADGFMAREDFRRGIAALRDYGLSYDILIYQRQLAEAEEFVRAFPGQVFVLDHMAKPDIRAHEAGDRVSFDAWVAGIRALAVHDNVYCKLSGMVTEADWTASVPATFEPYLATVIEAFGAARCMIGSDWPVCTLSGSYGDVTDIVRDYVGRLSAPEHAAILGGNALRAYGRT
jgi:L-fuconolactonase